MFLRLIRVTAGGGLRKLFDVKQWRHPRPYRELSYGTTYSDEEEGETRNQDNGIPNSYSALEEDLPADYRPPLVADTLPGLEEVSEDIRAPGYFHRLYKSPREEAKQRRIMNAHIREAIRNRDFGTALNVYEDMPMMGISPGKFTFKTLIGMLAAQDKMAELDRIYQDMVNWGCAPDTRMCAVLLEAFGRSRNAARIAEVAFHVRQLRPNLEDPNTLDMWSRMAFAEMMIGNLNNAIGILDWLREENAPVADCLQQLLRCTQGRHFKRYDIRATMLKRLARYLSEQEVTEDEVLVFFDYLCDQFEVRVLVEAVREQSLFLTLTLDRVEVIMMRISRALSIPDELEEELRSDALEMCQLLYLHLIDAQHTISEQSLQALLGGALSCDHYPLALRVALDMEAKGQQVIRWQSLLQLLMYIIKNEMPEDEALKIDEDDEDSFNSTHPSKGKELAYRLMHSLVNPNILSDFRDHLERETEQDQSSAEVDGSAVR